MNLHPARSGETQALTDWERVDRLLFRLSRDHRVSVRQLIETVGRLARRLDYNEKNVLLRFASLHRVRLRWSDLDDLDVHRWKFYESDIAGLRRQELRRGVFLQSVRDNVEKARQQCISEGRQCISDWKKYRQESAMRRVRNQERTARKLVSDLHIIESSYFGKARHENGRRLEV